MQRFFIIIILFLGAAIVGLFYLIPEWNKFGELRKETEKWNTVSAELDSLIQNRDALIDVVNSISKENLSRLDSSLPQGPHAADFLVLLENLSIEQGVTLKRVDLASFTEIKTSVSNQPKTAVTSFVTNRPINSVKELPINLTIAGTYDSLKSFLRALEKNLRLIEVKDISFGSPGKDQIFEFTIRAKTYYQ